MGGEIRKGEDRWAASQGRGPRRPEEQGRERGAAEGESGEWETSQRPKTGGGE